MNQKITCPHCMKTFEVAPEIFNTTVACPNCNGSFNPMNEFCKSAWELTKTQEFQAALEERVAKSNENITHSDFVAGMENKTIGYKVMFGKPSQMLTGARKTIFHIIVMFYLVVPFILIPIWAYIEHNWWLLIGIIVSLIATIMAATQIYFPQKQTSIGGYIGFICMLCWIFLGIHNYYTFFSLCALWGFMFYCIADNVESEYLTQLLLDDPDFYYNAIDQHRIMIVRADDL